MKRRPIEFAEKVNARYTRRSTGACWPWDGSFTDGRPRLNLYPVMRFIYEQEFGPIPPGMTLWRTDHSLECRYTNEVCRHRYCVNPYHLVLVARAWGIYPRDSPWDGRSTDHINTFSKKKRAKEREKNDRTRDQKGGNAPVDDRGLEGTRMEEPTLGESDRPRHS